MAKDNRQVGLKESLSDKILDNQELHSGALGLFNKKDVKEAVKKLKEMLGCNKKSSLSEEIDSIFGDDLI